MADLLAFIIIIACVLVLPIVLGAIFFLMVIIKNIFGKKSK